MKKPFLFILSGLLPLSVAQGQNSFSASFQDFFSSLTGLADSGGSTAGGLTWGFLIAEDAGSGFSSPILDLGLSLVDGAELVDGLRYFDGGVTGDAIFSDGGPGSPLDSGIVDHTAFADVNAGDSFALIWFDRGIASGDELVEGDNYGLLEDANFAVPNDGVTLANFGAFFGGPDPVITANLQVQAVPEPSAIVLTGLASLVLLRRRRS